MATSTLETIAVVGLGLLLVNKLGDSIAGAIGQGRGAVGLLPSLLGIPQVSFTTPQVPSAVSSLIGPLPGTPGGIGGPTTDANLNGAIDVWFANANLFGLVQIYDPTDWNGFAASVNKNALFPITVPAGPTAYFNAKSQAYWGVWNPSNPPVT